MQCATCGNDNPPEARFCARCGRVLAAAAIQTPAPSQPVNATPIAVTTPLAPAVEALRISTGSAVIGAVMLGFIVWLIALWPLSSVLRVGLDFTSLLGLVINWVINVFTFGVGVVGAYWVSARYRLAGKAPLVAGTLVLFTALVVLATSWRLQFYSYETLDRPFTAGLALLLSLGTGLAFPAAFWRHLGHVSWPGRVFLVLGGAIGIFVADWLTWNAGYTTMNVTAALFVLLIALPSALISPMVRAPRESSR